MLVYKFGGGVLKGAEGIRQMVEILKAAKMEKGGTGILVVVSALGKMTNSFEKLYVDWIEKKDHNNSLNEIAEFHQGILEELFSDGSSKIDLEIYYQEIKEFLLASGEIETNTAYSKLVSYGEILSSKIISAYLTTMKIDHSFIDAREVVITKEGRGMVDIDWDLTGARIKEHVDVTYGENEFPEGDGRIWLTQGFIASDSNRQPATLGREGSDFTASIFGNILDAKEVVLWKDVPGIMTADPAEFGEAEKMEEISYLEAIELSYFGAKIVHPKTIKPLQNKQIPLMVKSIYHSGDSGTKVLECPVLIKEKPVIIIKPNQVLLSIQPRDFSFIMEDAVSRVFAVLADYGIRVNLLQHGAVSLSLCIDYNDDKLNMVIGDLIKDFKVLYNSGLDLLTIRHYSDKAIKCFTAERKIFVQQQSRKTARFVLY